MSDTNAICCAVRVLRGQRQRFTYNCHKRIPEGIGGLYAFWLDSGACLYIGKSTNLSQRLYQHRMQEHNNRLDGFLRSFAQQIYVSHVTAFDCEGEDLQPLEKHIIRVFRPLTNIQSTI